MIERTKKRVRLLNQAEQLRQRFLFKGVGVANKASDMFLESRNGKRFKTIRKFKAKLA